MFLDAIAEADATGPLKDYYERQRAAWGFLPNYAGAFAARPAVAAAWDQLSSAVRGGMDRRRFEIATIAAACASRCTYCAVAHATFLRDVCDDGATVETIAADLSGAGLGPEDRAVYAFATKVAADPASVRQEDVDALRELGLSDTDVADLVYAVAARAFFTRVLDGLGAQLDHQTAASVAPQVLEALTVGRSAARG